MKRIDGWCSKLIAAGLVVLAAGAVSSARALPCNCLIAVTPVDNPAQPSKPYLFPKQSDVIEKWAGPAGVGECMSTCLDKYGAVYKETSKVCPQWFKNGGKGGSANFGIFTAEGPGGSYLVPGYNTVLSCLKPNSGVSGIQKGAVDTAMKSGDSLIGKAKYPCPAGWQLDKESVSPPSLQYFCKKPNCGRTKQELQCPDGTQFVRKGCSIGCETKIY